MSGHLSSYLSEGGGGGVTGRFAAMPGFTSKYLSEREKERRWAIIPRKVAQPLRLSANTQSAAAHAAAPRPTLDLLHDITATKDP